MVDEIKLCANLNYIENFVILASVVTGCIPISAFVSFLSTPIEITSSEKELKTCAIAVRIKRYKSIIKKKDKKHDKIALPAKSKMNRIKAIIFKDLIDSNISHYQFVLINIVLKEYDDMTEEIRNLKT